MIHTQAEAKRFFAERAVQRARDEGAPLSDAARGMLSWSESDPAFTADPQRVAQLVEQLASEMSDEEYEERIAGLLTRRFAEEVAGDAGAKDAWQHALSVLNQGDHYIAIMIDRALGPRLKVKRWWEFWR